MKKSKLLERIVRLESELASLKEEFATLAGIVAKQVVGEIAVPDITAESITIVDKRGCVRAQLMMNDHGPGLRLYGADGVVVASFNEYDGEGIVSVSNGESGRRGHLGAGYLTVQSAPNLSHTLMPSGDIAEGNEPV